MIRSDKEYRYTVERIEDFARQIDALAKNLSHESMNSNQIDLATAPLKYLMEELVWERDLYDSLRDPDEGLGAVPSYPPEERGKALIAIRIALRMSQKDVADALGVSQAQISRDENNDYRGITQERFARVLRAMGVIEDIASYRSQEAIVIDMPIYEDQAASFTPNNDHYVAPRPLPEQES